jgi:flavodoxin I
LKQVGIFFGSSSGKTAAIAGKIQEKLGKERSDLWDVEQSSPEDMMDYDFLILGIPTWGIGKTQEDWDVLMPMLENLDFSRKKVALFGLGDQESYPGTFADGLGKLYEILLSTGCSFTGSWPVAGYAYEGSTAVKGGRFVGLVLDEENQPEKSNLRIDKWLKDILEDVPSRESNSGGFNVKSL